MTYMYVKYVYKIGAWYKVIIILISYNFEMQIWRKTLMINMILRAFASQKLVYDAFSDLMLKTNYFQTRVFAK